MTRNALAILMCLLAGTWSTAADPMNLSRLRWSVAYAWLWDAAAAGYDSNPKYGYGFAISPDASSFYLGYNNSGPDGNYEGILRVRRDPSALTTNAFATNAS